MLRISLEQEKMLAETTYRIEKVLEKKRNRDGELELKVRFVGYPNDTYWIKQSDLVA